MKLKHLFLAAGFVAFTGTVACGSDSEGGTQDAGTQAGADASDSSGTGDSGSGDSSGTGDAGSGTSDSGTGDNSGSGGGTLAVKTGFDGCHGSSTDAVQLRLVSEYTANGETRCLYADFGPSGALPGAVSADPASLLPIRLRIGASQPCDLSGPADGADSAVTAVSGEVSVDEDNDATFKLSYVTQGTITQVSIESENIDVSQSCN